MWKYELWCDSGFLHETDYIYETEEEAMIDGEADKQSYFDDFELEGCEYEDDEIWVKTESEGDGFMREIIDYIRKNMIGRTKSDIQDYVDDFAREEEITWEQADSILEWVDEMMETGEL